MSSAVPEGWSNQKLGDFAKLKRGITYVVSDLVDKNAGKPLYLNMKSFRKDGGYNHDGEKYFGAKYKDSDVIGDNELVIANTDVTPTGDIIGAPALIPHSNKTTILCSHHVSRLVLDGSIQKNFLYYLLCSGEIRQFMRQIGRGTTVLMIDNDALLKLKTQLPPLPEQQKIATILSSVDDVIEKTQAQIDKLKDLKTGMMQELLTKGIGHTEFKDSPIGRIPVGWDFKLLDQVARRGSGHTPDKKNPEYWNDGVKWVSLTDSYRLDQLYISDTDKKISDLGIDNSSAVLHPEGTVIMSRDAGIGKSAITTEEMAVSQHFMAWGCGDLLDNYFLYYLLQYWKPKFEAIAMGSTIKTIGLPYFKKLQIPVPPIEEQKRIANSIKSVDMKIFVLEDKNSKNKDAKKSLMQDLLTGKVRVNLGAQNG